MPDTLRGNFNEVRAVVDTALSSWVTAIDSVLFAALRGDRLAARTYATAFIEMTEVMCRLVTEQPNERAWLHRVLRREAVSIPFRACSVEGRPGLSVAMTLVGDIRQMLPTVPRLQWPAESREPLTSLVTLEDQQVATFERLVDRIVDRSVSPLEEVIAVFDLSYTDAGRLFGVTRQAITQWLAEGVPAERQSKVVTVAQVATLLRHYLVPERIPGIARKPAEQYGGRSMLEMIATDEHEELLGLTRRSFDWSTSA
jgi:DNA-directed RNA polymerase specialized sigma24 family protein